MLLPARVSLREHLDSERGQTDYEERTCDREKGHEIMRNALVELKGIESMSAAIWETTGW